LIHSTHRVWPVMKVASSLREHADRFFIVIPAKAEAGP
jgi:hypothetical protein